MRILYFTDTFLPQVNGVTNTLQRLDQFLERNNIRHMFFAPDYSEGSTVFEEKNVRRFLSISFPAYPECRLSFPNYSNLSRMADKFKPDIVHLMTPVGLGLVGLKYAREKGLPVVSSYTTNFDSYLKYYKLEFLNNLLWNYFRWFHNSCGINLCPSHDTAEYLEARGIENIRLMSRGIDTEGYNPSRRSNELRGKLNAAGRTVFLYVGRLAAEKDLDILMESIGQVNRAYSGKAQFIITGDGPLAESLKNEAPDNVLFTGYLKGENLSALYASADVFVFPSSTETFGNVVLEAMASGLPVIGVNSGGVKENVIHGYNGFLCTPRNAGSFTEAMIKLMEDASLKDKMSGNAREYTLGKSWESVFHQLMSDYTTLRSRPAIGAKLPAKAG